MPELAPSRQRSPIADLLLAAARERAHDRRSAADVGAVADDDARGDAALDHRRAERAGVEVAEPLVHHGRALGEVGAEAHRGRRRRCARPAGRRSRSSAGTCRARARAAMRPLEARAARRTASSSSTGDRAEVGPRHVGQQPEDAVEVERVRRRQPVRQQVQPQVDVRGDGRRRRRRRSSAGSVGRRRCGARRRARAGRAGVERLGRRHRVVAVLAPAEPAGTRRRASSPSAATVARPAPQAVGHAVSVESCRGRSTLRVAASGRGSPRGSCRRRRAASRRGRCRCRARRSAACRTRAPAGSPRRRVPRSASPASLAACSSSKRSRCSTGSLSSL